MSPWPLAPRGEVAEGPTSLHPFAPLSNCLLGWGMDRGPSWAGGRILLELALGALSWF